MTRARLTEAVDDMELSEDGFPHLDYRRDRRNGSSIVELLELAPDR